LPSDPPISLRSRIQLGGAAGVARALLITGVARALLIMSLLAGCSPYVYSDSVQALNMQMHVIDGWYQDNEQQTAAEKQLRQRLVWVRDRTELVSGPGCTVQPPQPGTVSPPCALRPVAMQNAALLAVDTAVRPQPGIRTTDDVCRPDPNPAPTSSRSPADTTSASTGKAPPPAAPRLLKALDDYTAALAALTTAQDRADFDNAAAKLSAAEGALASQYGPAVQASSSALLWVVGQDLDHRRLEALKVATEEACKPVHFVVDALGHILENDRRIRLLELKALLGLRLDALAKEHADRHVTDEVYGAAIDDAQAAANVLQAVKASDPQAAIDAFGNAHDQLVVAVRNNDGQIDALVTATQAFVQQANNLTAVTSAGTASNNKL
jgi:hypothetical protein